MSKPRFAEDTTDTLEFYPPENAVPSTATVVLYTPGETELQASATATIDSESTTIAATASRGARSFTVASATGLTKGRRYMVVESGQTWSCEIKIIASTTVYPTTPVPFDLTTAATLKAYRLSYALTTTHTADVDENYNARWSYTVNGAALTSPQIQLFDVIAARSYFPTTLDNVLNKWAWLSNHLRDHDLDGLVTMQTVWDQVLVPALKSRSMDIGKVRDLEALMPLHVAMINRHMVENMAIVDDAKLDSLVVAREDVANILQETLSDVSWYDADEDLAVDGGEEGIKRTYARVSR